MCRKGILLTLVVAVLSVCLLGCQVARQASIDISVEEIKNTEMLREVGLNYLSVWPMYSGIIRGSLGVSINELPSQAVAAMDELDKMAALHGPDAQAGDYSDYELGLSLGLKSRLLCEVVLQALEQYAPDVIELLPLVL